MRETPRQTADEIDQSTTVRTFLIADVRGYTQFTAERGDVAAARLASRFAAVCREVVAGRDGEVIELRGDEALAVFSSTRQALHAALELQAHFAEATSTDSVYPLRVGIGLDAGEAIPLAGGYRGSALNRAARLCALAGPSQILASETIVSLAGRTEGLQYAEQEPIALKGFADPVRVVEVQPATVSGQPSTAPTSGPSGGDAAEIVESAKLPIGGFLGSLPAAPLVAREAEFQAILTVIDTVASAEGRTVLLLGEPGAGKTRLAQEVTLNLRNRGFLIAAGRCYEAEQTVAYYPFLEALARVYEMAPHDIQREAGQRWPYLGALLPNHLPTPEVAGGSDEQQRVFFAVTSFLEAIARVTPIGLLLDDLHWSDSASLKLFLHLARRTRSSRVFMLGTYRDVEVGRQHPLEDALRELSREALAERIAVRRLDQEGTAALIASEVDEEVSDEFAGLVFSRTEGNPFFVQQVLRVMVERGDVFQQDGRWDRRDITEIEVPESVRAVIGQRLSRLSEAAQEFLREASVLGQTFTFEEIGAVSRLSADDLETALDEAERAGLVRSVGRDAYAFDHALTQQSLYAELTSRRRRGLHQTAAEAIESLSGRAREKRAAELAWHFLEGDTPERAIPYALEAGEQSLAVFAYAEAEWHFRMAVELAREFENRAVEARALQRLADSLMSQGRYEEAIERLEEAAALHAKLGDVDGELRAVSGIGWAHHLRVARPEAIARLEPVLARVPDQPSEGLASFLVALATLYFHEARHQEALALSERAAAVARDLGDERLLGRALARQASALAMLGQSDKAVKVFKESIELGERVGDLATLNISLNNLAFEYGKRGEVGHVLPTHQRQIEAARRSGAPDDLAWALLISGNLLFGQGNWSEAQAYLEEAAGICRVLGPTRSSPALGLSAALRLWSGEEDARGELEVLARSTDSLLREAGVYNLVPLEIIHDQAASTAARLEPMLHDPNVEAQRRPFVLRQLATATMLCGDITRAQELLERAQAMPLTHPAWVEVTSGLAGLRVAQGRQAEAGALMNEVRDNLQQRGLRGLEALLLLEHGYIQARLGTSDRARITLGDSLALFHQIGASAALARIEQLLEELG